MKRIKSGTFYLHLLLVNFLLLTINCSAPEKATAQRTSSNVLPDWVMDPSSAFNERTYLMATGSGDNLADARSDAMINLAQIFRSQIDGTQSLFSEFEETTRNNSEFTSNTSLQFSI